MTIHATRLRFWGRQVLDSHPLGFKSEAKVTDSADGIVRKLGYRRMEVGLFDEVLITGNTCGGRFYKRQELNDAKLELKEGIRSRLLGESTRYTSGPYRKERR